MTKIKKSIVVAKSNNNVIGADNTLPWHLPEDLKHFKRLTLGHPIVMGRLTYESIGRPLPGRKTIVITGNTSWSPNADGVQIVSSVEQAMVAGEEQAKLMDVERVMIVGGAGVYRQCIDVCDELFVTALDLDIKGDAFFPEINLDEWKVLERSDRVSESDDKVAFSFITYVRSDA